MKKYKYSTSFTYEGRRYSVHADTKADLAVKKALKLRDIQEGKVIVTGNMLVEDWAKKCVKTYKTRQKPVTREKYMARLRKTVFEEIGNMPLKSVKPITCQEVLNKQTGRSKTQVNEVYQALKFIFGKAKENKLIVDDPTEGLVKPTYVRGKRRAITEEERKYILDLASKKRRYYIFLLMLQCSCRPSEAGEAMGKDIVLVEGYNALHIRGTKTENADRYVPIPDSLYELIKGTPKYEHIALDTKGRPINTVDRRRDAWHMLKREMNIAMGCEVKRNAIVPPYRVAPDLYPYCLRHTFCTDMARKGIDIRMTQYLMGHANISITADIYTELNYSDITSVAEAIGASTHPVLTQACNR